MPLDTSYLPKGKRFLNIIKSKPINSCVSEGKNFHHYIEYCGELFKKVKILI